MSQQLRDLKIKVFTESSGSALESSVQDFFQAGGTSTDQARIVSWTYQVDGGEHHLTLIYAE